MLIKWQQRNVSERVHIIFVYATLLTFCEFSEFGELVKIYSRRKVSLLRDSK